MASSGMGVCVGVVRRGSVWCSLVWFSEAWRVVAWCGVEWCGVKSCGVAACGVVWVWCGVMCRGVVWCGTVCLGVLLFLLLFHVVVFSVQCGVWQDACVCLSVCVFAWVL